MPPVTPSSPSRTPLASSRPIRGRVQQTPTASSSTPTQSHAQSHTGFSRAPKGFQGQGSQGQVQLAEETPKRSGRARMPSSSVVGEGPGGVEGDGQGQGHLYASVQTANGPSGSRTGSVRSGSYSGSVSADSGVLITNGNPTSGGSGKQSKRSVPSGPTSSSARQPSTKPAQSLNGKSTKLTSTVGTSHKKKIITATNTVKPKAKPAKYLQAHQGGARRPPSASTAYVSGTAIVPSSSSALDQNGDQGIETDGVVDEDGEEDGESEAEDGHRESDGRHVGKAGGSGSGQGGQGGARRPRTSQDVNMNDGQGRRDQSRANSMGLSAPNGHPDNPDSRLHEYPEEPNLAIDPAILGDVPPMVPRASFAGQMDPGLAPIKVVKQGWRSSGTSRIQRTPYQPTRAEPSQDSPANEYPASPPPMVDTFALAEPEPTSPYVATGPAAENQVFTMLGANGKIVNIPPPAHPHLRPGDTITDTTTPHIHGCPYCDKVYVGQHARSICRRHQMSKHGIELDVQVKKSRWDNNPNRPATEEEKHQRTLESKRRWAAKDRRRRRCQKLGIPFEDSDKESDEEDDSVRSNSRDERRPNKAGGPLVVKRESSYEDSHGSYEAPTEDFSAPTLQDDGRWEAPAPAGYSSRGYYLPDEYAASERGQPMENFRRDSLGRRPSNLANDGFVPRMTDVSTSRTRSGSVTSEGSAEPEEEEEAPAARGSDRTVNPSFHTRTGSWAQQNMSGYGRPAGTTQSPYGSNAPQYMQQSSYQPGLSPARNPNASSMRTGQTSPPRFGGRAILQDGRVVTGQWAELGAPLEFAANGQSERGVPTEDQSVDHLDTGPKTPPLQSSSGTKAQIDLGAAEILLAMASPAKGPPVDDRPNLTAVAKNGRRDAERARRHRSNSSQSNTASMFPAPEATPQRRSPPLENRKPQAITVKLESEDTPYGRSYDPALMQQGPTPLPSTTTHWRHRELDLDDPFRPPSLSRSGFDHSSSVSRGTGHSPMTPAELGPAVEFRAYRRAPPPAPAFARSMRIATETRHISDRPEASGFTSPATPLGKELPSFNRPALPPFDGGRYITTSSRPSAMAPDSPIGMPFSSPNGLDLTHQLGLAPAGAMPESPTWWADMMGATPDAKVTKRSRHSPAGGEENEALGGLASPTKKPRAAGMLA